MTKEQISHTIELMKNCNTEEKRKHILGLVDELNKIVTDTPEPELEKMINELIKIYFIIIVFPGVKNILGLK